jgi:hypothetical protein
MGVITCIASQAAESNEVLTMEQPNWRSTTASMKYERAHYTIGNSRKQHCSGFGKLNGLSLVVSQQRMNFRPSEKRRSPNTKHIEAYRHFDYQQEVVAAYNQVPHPVGETGGVGSLTVKIPILQLGLSRERTARERDFTKRIRRQSPGT